MSDQSWQLIEHVFNVAIEMPAAERAAYLESACLNETIRAEVESLIEAEEKSKTFFEGRIAAAASEAVADRERAQPKRVHYLGPYRILETISAVAQLFLAERSDGTQVAIRLLQAGSDEAVARVAAARRRLERLDHPNIVRTLDGGVTPKGAPYTVTERFEGEPLEAWCDRNTLTVERRLELFRIVCGALHFGHRNMLLHGALDASTVCVAADGTLKLTDYGLVRLQDAVEGASAARRRRSLEYLSPEELRGEPATTSSEVYSLGVLLYELLAGRKPHDLREASRVEIERIVGEIEPQPPSAAVRGGRAEAVSRGRGVAPAALERRLRGDLDAIVLRALHKTPGERYASAEHLAEDVGRFLAGRPVHARGEDETYRTASFVRRHRAAVACAAALAAGLAMAAAWGWMSARRTGEESVRARQAQREAETAAGFLTGALGVADRREQRAAAVTALEALNWGAERAERELSSRPLEQAAVLDALSDAYLRLGLHDRALELAEASLAGRRTALGERSPGAAAGLCRLGRVELDRGRAAEALTHYRRAAGIYRQAGSDHTAGLAGALAGSAAALAAAGALDEAEAEAREALELRLAGLPENDPAVAADLHSLGAIERRLGRLEEAEGRLRRALEIRRSALGDVHPDTAATLEQLGLTLREAGRLEEAEETLGKALSATLELHGERHPAAADSLRTLAAVLRQRGRLNEAREMLRVALDVDRAALGPNRLEVASDLAALGGLAREQGDLAEAEERFAEAESLLLAAPYAGAEVRRRRLEVLEQVYRAWGRVDDAARVADERAKLR